MQLTMILQLYIHSLSMDRLLNGWLAELPAILDSFLTDIANTTSTPTVVVDGRWVGGNHKVAGKGCINTENS